MQLPVLSSRDAAVLNESAGPGASEPLGVEAVEDLRAAIRGAVRFGRHDRMLYATDASIYQVEPLGVVIPADAADVAAAVAWCSARGVAMLPRGGGTSLAGQCTARAVVLDTSPGLKAVRDLDAAGPTPSVYAEAGVTLDDLNAALARASCGHFFAPDPSTSGQATVGGAIGNNASGSRSVMYGRTVDSVLATDVVVAGGTALRLGPGAGAAHPIALKLADGVMRVCREHAGRIREGFPRTLRRNAGYALDLVLKQMDAGATAHELDLTPLLCGSEGTLAVTLGARLRLFAAPAGKGLALVSFGGVDEAIEAVRPLLATGPSAVELVDDVVIEAALGNRECREYVKAFPNLRDGAAPAAVLYVEYHTGSPEELPGKFEACRRAVGAAPMRVAGSAAEMANAWKLRKAGEPLLHGLPGRRKPLTFVEDNAVPVERLGEFVREFRRIVERAGTRAAFWAHASVGVLHVRPLLDPDDPADMAKLRSIAVEVADLAKALGGVMSGEHGDGKVRGPLLERFYGPELMRAFREVKGVFDPRGLLNPGNIVAPGPIESITQRTRTEPQAGAGSAPPGGGRRVEVPPVDTYYDYADQDGFAHAVERCNGAGVCRKSSGGTMCPSYRGTLDERHATRGRGNALRLAITGQLQPGADPKTRFRDPETLETLDLCLACKACKTECPSNVDIARLKAEYLAQKHRSEESLPLHVLLTGHVRKLNRVGAVTPGLANWFNGLPPVRALINRVMKLHPRRSLPPFSASLYSLWRSKVAQPAAGAPRVALFGDCFTCYNESPIGLAAGRLLTGLGYAVELPAHGCCGRAMISTGMLPQAIAEIDATLARLRPLIEDDGCRAILVVEPSCLSAIKDDWLSLKCATPIALRRRLAAKSMLVEEFVERQWEGHPSAQAKARLVAGAGPASGASPPVVLHAHCHQKALWGAASSAAILRRVVGPRLTVLDTGCCGMAGSFGYHADKFDLSMRIANLDAAAGAPGALAGAGPGGGVLPHVRAARGTGAIVLAPGTSCRHQIKDGEPAGPRALHPVEFLASLLDAP